MSEPGRVEALVAAGIALSSELSLEALLHRLVETAASLTGARYAALGVIDEEGSGLERFVYTGIDREQADAIGDLPQGRGLLGALIRDARSLRLDDLSDDPRSAGFPPNHPPMRTFLGVPIVLRGRAFGNLYLSEKAEGAPFTGEDQRLVEMLASQAAVAVENARLFESATLWSRQLEALNEVGTALAGEIELPRLLALVTERLGELIDARLVTIALPAEDGRLVVRAAAGESSDVIVGVPLEPAGSKSGRVLERGVPERVDDVAGDAEVDRETALRLGLRTGLYVPLVVRDRPIGIVVAHDKRGDDPRFTDDDFRIAQAFAVRAAVAVDLSERVAGDALRHAVAAQELERRRLARELHDQTGQELTSILLGLKAVEKAPDEAERERALGSVREQVLETLRDVRRLAVELRPKALDDFGLVPALERLLESFGEQTGLRVDLEARIDERLPADVETAIYRIVQEALTNVVKHARASSISVVLGKGRGVVTAVVEDDGRGFELDRATDGLGIVGMRERLALLGGRLEIETASDRGTTIVAEVPLP